MSHPRLASHRDAAAFRAHLQSVHPEMDCIDQPFGAASPLASAFQHRDRTLGNRFAVHPMEGWDATTDGRPSELTLRRWKNFGSSGADLIWGGEAFAVAPEGRANPNQLAMLPGGDPLASMQMLREALLEGRREAGLPSDGLMAGLQLTHSGRWARPTVDGPAPRTVFRHPVLDRRVGIEDDTTLLSDAELEAIAAAFVEAAVHAQAAGFDFVDVKCCHGYLLHEVLAGRARPGKYGGSFKNRTTLFREIVAGIREAAPGLEIGVRVSIADLYPFAEGVGRIGAPDGELLIPYEHGFGVDALDPLRFDLEEPLLFLALLQELDIRLVNLSVGSPYYCPHVQRPAAFPPSDGYLPPEDPLRSVTRQLEVVRQVRAACPALTVVGSGYSYLQDWLPHVAAHEVGAGHVDFIGLGRMILSYPEMPRDVIAGGPLQRKRICRTFSDCTTGPRHGMISGCFPLDPFYKEMPEAKEVRALRPAKGDRT